MTCEEFRRVLPELEGDHTVEQEEHLKTCSSCSDLVSDLNAISEEARLLAADLEPSPRVWNAIEIALRREGLIRDLEPQVVLSGSRSPRPRFAWLTPVSIALVSAAVFFFVSQYPPRSTPGARQPAPSTPVASSVVEIPEGSAIDADETQLLNFVASRAPTMRAGYESDLRAVNAYIRDAETSVRDNPNDQIAQQYLMNAYEQRAMVYEMAMERVLR
ncbi:MAG TPA: hypothetical protein VEK33_19300 [Terriglobales bacterium]|nr:hypothetical protein [Terriglobales bacterium]